jgi:hypothetical protein
MVFLGLVLKHSRNFSFVSSHIHMCSGNFYSFYFQALFVYVDGGFGSLVEFERADCIGKLDIMISSWCNWGRCVQHGSPQDVMLISCIQYMYHLFNNNNNNVWILQLSEIHI